MLQNNHAELVTTAKNAFNTICSQIVGHVSHMLREAKLLPLSELSTQIPSYTEMVTELKYSSSLCEYLNPLLNNTLTSEIDVVNKLIMLADNLAKAIEIECTDSLGAAIAALDEEPYI